MIPVEDIGDRARVPTCLTERPKGLIDLSRSLGRSVRWESERQQHPRVGGDVHLR